MGKDRSSQLCCDVKERGGKISDINQYVLSLRFNFIFLLFDNNYQSSWKSLENRCIDDNVLFGILRSNLKLNSMLVGRVAFLHFTLTTLRTLQHSPMSTMIPNIYGLIKRLNIEINECLLRNFAKPEFLIFSAT